MTTLSVVIPCRNGERYLAETIRSILAQPVPDLEIVYVDDRSTDRSIAIAHGFGDRVRCLAPDVADVSAVRDAGVAAARGSIIAFSDADDLWSADRLPGQLRHLTGLPPTGISTGLTEPFISPDIIAGANALATFDPHPHFFRHPGALLLRRETLDRVGPFEAGDGHDMMTWIARATDLAITFDRYDHVVQRRRVHLNNISRARDRGTARFARSLKATLDRRRAAAQRDSG